MVKETAYVVLFRGVGGDTQLPVKRLREVLTEAGFRNVATYINSGNAVLSSSASEEEIVARVAAVVSEKMGFGKSVFARSAAEWAWAVDANPYPQAVETPTKLHLYCLEREPDPDRVAALQEKATGTERFVVKGRVLYLHTPDGMGRSLFAPKIEPTLKVPMTARNWRTALALRRMVEAL
ncbi:DUF1697 domain-containing protein [Chelativorans sp. SCAU2101]|jgi:uncharacterized protein (DUF1697 family)|uniref:DUF1697 domain-containing protein n=1 Tax=Chelativorans petroleitrophicus TaxID=2975484 RepID=A0A9X3B6P1_9HYPH|nr:DUF1697 domain-containing protein [Chelativorans petroleitrophicus]MCT8990773.1 DUF1697 domain-containing protein [Chelativorans petroleitrophicus]